MHAAFPSTPHQTRSLQRLLHPGVAQLDAVLGLQLLVEVLHVQIEILLPVECEHLLHRRHRNPPMRRLAPSPVQQPVVPLFLIAFPPPPHVPVTDPQDLRRLKPGNLLRHCLQHYILYFHRPLHRGPRISFHAPHGLPPSPPAKRTSHLLSHPDISCATDRSPYPLDRNLPTVVASPANSHCRWVASFKEVLHGSSLCSVAP